MRFWTDYCRGFQVKPIGTSLATCTNWTLVFVVTYVSTELTRWLGHAGCFLTFSIFCLLGGAFAASVIPETKNKTLAEIQMKLIGKSKAVPVAVDVVDAAEQVQATTTVHWMPIPFEISANVSRTRFTDPFLAFQQRRFQDPIPSPWPYIEIFYIFISFPCTIHWNLYVL